MLVGHLAAEGDTGARMNPGSSFSGHPEKAKPGASFTPLYSRALSETAALTSEQPQPTEEKSSKFWKERV